MAITDYAKGLVKMYDKNGDMMLSAEERKDLKGRAADADLNKDGTITIDELVAHLSSGSSSSSSTSMPSSSSSSSSTGKSDSDAKKVDADLAKRVLTGTAGGSAAGAKEGDKRRSYRFSTAADRLPSGLPSSFKSKDTNHDGQVSMSEYSHTWTERLVTEFRKIDVNGDGMITAKEAVKMP